MAMDAGEKDREQDELIHQNAESIRRNEALIRQQADYLRDIRAIELAPFRADLYRERAKVFSSLGDKRKAAADLKDAEGLERCRKGS